nr:zinc-binding dehydrogenase [Candidatus Eremiobacteraeota bacterium]
ALGSDVDGPSVGMPVIIDPLIGWGGDPHVWSANASILGMPLEGTFAEYVVVPASNVHNKPAHLSYAQAAAMPLAGVTAYRATFTRGALKAGETVLITGIGGGVQTFVLLYAKHIGARAIVTSSSDAKLARAVELGADVAVNYARSKQWHKDVKASAGAPIDLVIDSAGGDAFAKAISIVRPGGRVVSYGGTSGDATIKLFPLFWNQLTICGSSMGSPWDFQAMLELVSSGIVPVVDRVFPMSEAVAAFEYLDRAEQFGKVVLEITP